MLTKLRARFNRLFYSVAKYLANIGVKPNHVTISGLIISLLSPFIVYFMYRSAFLALVLVALSALCDVLDGAIAKLTESVTPLGAFLDSISDRVSDIAYSIMLLILGMNAILVTIFMSTSLLISYIRARAESLGIKLEGIGIMERAERVLAVLLILLIMAISEVTAAHIVMLIVSILNVLTILQRGMKVWRSMKKDLRHGYSL